MDPSETKRLDKTKRGKGQTTELEDDLLIQKGGASIDSLDQQIINLLVINGRDSSETLAQKLKVDSSTIRRRINKLVQKGALSFSVNPNPVFLGFQTAIVLAINASPDKLNGVIEELGQHPEVRWLLPITGRFDILSVIWFANNESIYDFVTNVVGKIPGVIRTEMFVCLGRPNQRVRRSW